MVPAESASGKENKASMNVSSATNSSYREKNLQQTDYRLNPFDKGGRIPLTWLSSLLGREGEGFVGFGIGTIADKPHFSSSSGGYYPLVRLHPMKMC